MFSREPWRAVLLLKVEICYGRLSSIDSILFCLYREFKFRIMVIWGHFLSSLDFVKPLKRICLKRKILIRILKIISLFVMSAIPFNSNRGMIKSNNKYLNIIYHRVWIFIQSLDLRFFWCSSLNSWKVSIFHLSTLKWSFKTISNFSVIFQSQKLKFEAFLLSKLFLKKTFPSGWHQS